MEKRTLVLISSCAAFLGLGMTGGSIGTALADLAAHTDSSEAAAGGVISGMFFGALLAQSLAGRVYDRFGAKPVMMTGLALLGIGTVAMTFSTSLTALLALSVLTGIGQGSLSISVNVNISALYPDKRTSTLNILNVFFGVGAVLGPAIASLSLVLWNTALPGLWSGAVVMLLQLPLLMVLLQTRRKSDEDAPQESAAGLYRIPLLWLFALYILLYVGVETGIGGWTKTYVVRTAVLSAETGALLTAGFWLMLTVGRLLAAYASHHTTPQRILWCSMVGSVVGGVMFAIGVGSQVLTVGAVLLLGLSYGPVFPTTMALVTTRFNAAPGRAASVVMAFAGMGGSLIPGIHGVLLEQVGPSASALYEAVLIFMMVGLLFGIAWAQAGKRKKA